MKKRYLYLVLLVCLILGIVVYLLPKTEQNTPATPAKETNKVVEAQKPPVAKLQTKQDPKKEPEKVQKEKQKPSKQVLATRSMIAAHESLRQPSVADPDSKENQEALQSMVFKALSNSSSAPQN